MTDNQPMSLTIQDRIALAKEALAEGRIIQGAWHRKPRAGGKKLVCALAAFGRPGDINQAGDCPADLMPPWLAQLVPVVDDGIAADQVHWFMGELIRAAERWHVLDDAAWERIRIGFLVASIRQALDSAALVQPEPEPVYWRQVVAACDGVIAALESGNAEKLKAARAAAEAAAAWAARAPAAAEAAAWADAAVWEAWAAAMAAYKTMAETLFRLLDVEIDAASGN